jgi:uncharacterized protein with von Willebrand factor type A (vWA) domain
MPASAGMTFVGTINQTRNGIVVAMTRISSFGLQQQDDVAVGRIALLLASDQVRHEGSEQSKQTCQSLRRARVLSAILAPENGRKKGAGRSHGVGDTVPICFG